MIRIEDMSDPEISALLSKINYGHLGCSRDDQPYVVPIHFAFMDPYIYIYTTDGKKSAILAENPKICLQVEEVTDNERWQSVILNGQAEEITDDDESARIVKLITASNPTLTPAISIRWLDDWIRENIRLLYRITPTSSSGRRSVN